MTSDQEIQSLRAVAQAARSFSVLLEGVGHTADWPLHVSSDDPATIQDFCARLNALNDALALLEVSNG